MKVFIMSLVWSHDVRKSRENIWWTNGSNTEVILLRGSTSVTLEKGNNLVVRRSVFLH